MPRRDALDTLMAAMVAEYERQNKLLETTAERLQKDIEIAKERTERLQERIQKVIEDGKDDDGEHINPDISEALDYLENEGIADLDELVGAVETVESAQGDVGRRLEELRDIVDATPKDSFFYVPPDEEDDDDDDDDQPVG